MARGGRTRGSNAVVGGNTRSLADHYTQKAKKEGYPARSVYKLQEIDQKFFLINKGMKLLDVGAAPGSWTMYALECVGRDGFVCSVDLKEITLETAPNTLFLRGDAFNEANLNQIKAQGLYDGLICDAAPSTTGNRLVDVAGSTELVEQVIDLSLKVVCSGGFLIVKIFQGGDERALSELIQQSYKICRKLKPKACRKESFESYLIGINRED